jgi:hypothetical protein
MGRATWAALAVGALAIAGLGALLVFGSVSSSAQTPASRIPTSRQLARFVKKEENRLSLGGERVVSVRCRRIAAAQARAKWFCRVKTTDRTGHMVVSLCAHSLSARAVGVPAIGIVG